VLDRDLVRLVTSRFGAGRSTTPGSASEEVAEEVFGTLPPGLRMLDVMELSLDAMQSVVTRYRLAGYPPDLLITVPKDACRTLDFHKAGEMIALGRELTATAVDESPLSRNG
jgi:NTE family protein